MNSVEKIIWSDSFSVNNDHVDAQHKKLLSIFSRLVDIVDGSRDLNQMAGLLLEMTDYAIKHFRAEEEYMESISYPNIEEHRLLHRDYSSNVLNYTTDYLNQDSKRPEEVLNFLREWWVGHILSADQEYAVYARVNGNQDQSGEVASS